MRTLLSVSLVALAIVPAAAQDTTLHVLRHTPADTGIASSNVSVTFDRPVAGRLDASVDPAKVLRIEPAIPGRLYWRDPITIKFAPREALRPGTSLTVTVDSSLRAIDGSRLAAPYQFTVRVHGPRLLDTSIPGWRSNTPGTLPIDGKVKLLYSAPVDLELLAPDLALLLGNCGGATAPIAMRPVAERPLGDSDEYRFAGGYNWQGDPIDRSFYRVVELEPALPLPPDCQGRLELPTVAEDAEYGRAEQFPILTAPLFRLVPHDCPVGVGCSVKELTLWFTAPLKRRELLRHLTFDPAVPFVIDGDVEESPNWNLNLRFVPRSTYTIVLDSTLLDINGRAIQGPHRVQFKTSDYVPELSYARGSLTTLRAGSRSIPLRHINVGVARVIISRVRESAGAKLLALAPYGSLSGAQLDSLTTPPETTLVTLQAGFNVPGATELSIPASAGALVALRIEIAATLTGPAKSDQASVDSTPSNHANHVWYGDVALIQFTDLAVHAKLGVDTGMVLVTGLADGRPRSGVTVRHLDASGALIAAGITDRTGMAVLARAAASTDAGVRGRRKPAVLGAPLGATIEATLGDDRAILPFTGRVLGYETDDLDPWLIGGRSGRPPVAAAAIFPDRGIYRPGEFVHLKGIVRHGMLGALETMPGEKVRLTLTTEGEGRMYEDETVFDTVLTTGSYGTIADSVRLRPGLMLGTYTAGLSVGGPDNWEEVASDTFRLAEYRAPQFLVEARADPAPRFGGDTVIVRAAARYLFGAPMGRAVVQWSAELHELAPWAFKLPGADGWTVGEWDRSAIGDRSPIEPTRVLGVDTLDATGQVELRIPTAAFEGTRPGELEVQLAVTDLDRQVSSATIRIPVHPSRIYVLARKASREWYWTTGKTAATEIRAIRPNGASVEGVPISISVVRHLWIGWWQVKDTTLRTDTILTSGGVVGYQFVPPSPGSYSLRLSAPDGHGGTARTTLDGYALSGQGGWWSSSPERLALLVKDKDVAVGDVVRVIFDSPYDSALAWVAVEREGVLEQRRIVVKRGTNAIPVTITAAHIPNVFLSVLLLRLGALPAPPDSTSQLFHAGYRELHVSTAPHRLSVVVSPSAREIRPGDSAVVAVHVRDARGRGVRSEVTLWAVDEGVLALTEFRTPDVLARMYDPRGLGSRLWTSLATRLTSDPGLWVRAQPGRISLQQVVVTGAGIASPVLPSRLRTEFRTTAFYLSAGQTDARGRAVLRARLPDNLTTYRVMAVAVGVSGDFGAGDTSLLATRPLVVRPSLPRFVRTGDSLDAGAVVNARDGRAHSVTVEATSAGLNIRGASRAQLILAPGKGAEARFTFQAPSRESRAESVVVQLRASDGKHGDAVETRLPVRPDFTPRAHALIGALRDSSDVVMDLPEDIDDARSTVSIRLGTSPITPLLAAYHWLRSYPYYCTEQITSNGLSLIALWDATRGRDSSLLGKDPRAELQRLADVVVHRQRRDGAFRYWDDDGWSSPWLTTYAVLFLLDARERGVLVDSSVLLRAADYLREGLETGADTGGMNRFDRRARRLALGDRVAAVEFLRRWGKPELHAEDELLELAPRMTWEDRLRLAQVLAKRSDRKEQVRALVDAAWRAVSIAGARIELPDSARGERAFASSIAPAARLLTATIAVHPEEPLLGGLIETVLQQRRAERGWWWNTQDYASAVMALASLNGGEATPTSVRVLGGGRILLERMTTDSGASHALPLTGLLSRTSQGRAQLHLYLSAKRTERPIYFTVLVSEVPSKPPVTPDSKGVVVERWYERYADGRPITEVKEGEIVRVRLRVTVPSDREFVALEDPLPAGLEAIDLTLRTSGSLLPFVTVDCGDGEFELDRPCDEREGHHWQDWRYGTWSEGWWSPWEHKSMYDDRVVWFARMLWRGSYDVSYVTRATTSGRFVRPPAHAEEMYNPALEGRSDGGHFDVVSSIPMQD